MQSNKTMIFKEFTEHLPEPGKHLAVETRQFDLDAPAPPGGITVKNLWISLDPYQRGQMRHPDDKGTYSLPWIIGEPAVVSAYAIVLKSDNPAFKPSDHIFAMTSAAQYAAIPAELAAWAQVFPTIAQTIGLSPPTLLATLSGTGLAAYVTVFDLIPEDPNGKTLLITAAASGVGQLTGQLAKMKGMRVIGSTGSAEKAKFLCDLGFDGAWDYHTEKTSEALARLAPDGLDVFMDNVGGEQFETALLSMKDFGHIVSCGAISQYNRPMEQRYGVRTLDHFFLKRLTMKGFVCSDPQHAKTSSSFMKDMFTWLAEGKIKIKEEQVLGIEHAPEAMLRMWNGDKFGKLVVKVNDD